MRSRKTGRDRWKTIAASVLSIGPALEPLATPKPGNTHRLREAPDRRLEDFIAAAAAFFPVLLDAVENPEPPRIGFRIYNAVSTAHLLTRGNVNLGTSMLLVPLSVALGRLGPVDAEVLAEEASRLVRNTGVEDAEWFYRVFRLLRQSYLGRLESDIPDSLEPGWEERLRREEITLYRVLSKARWDPVSRELIGGYQLTLRAYHELRDKWGTPRWNDAVVNVFLSILSETLDGHIYRRNGARAALTAAEMAHVALVLGGMNTPAGRTYIRYMDEFFWRNGWNPGSTADIVAVAISLVLYNLSITRGEPRVTRQ